MRSRAGFFWCSLWLTLLLLLPLILVVGFLARQRQTQQELRQAAANQSQLQIEPGAQSVWCRKRSRPLCWCGRTARPTA